MKKDERTKLGEVDGGKSPEHGRHCHRPFTPPLLTSTGAARSPSSHSSSLSSSPSTQAAAVRMEADDCLCAGWV